MLLAATSKQCVCQFRHLGLGVAAGNYTQELGRVESGMTRPGAITKSRREGCEETLCPPVKLPNAGRMQQRSSNTKHGAVTIEPSKSGRCTVGCTWPAKVGNCSSHG